MECIGSLARRFGEKIFNQEKFWNELIESAFIDESSKRIKASEWKF